MYILSNSFVLFNLLETTTLLRICFGQYSRARKYFFGIFEDQLSAWIASEFWALFELIIDFLILFYWMKIHF